MSRWKILKSKMLFKAGFFRARVDECELPDGRVMPHYYVFEFPDWVNVVPVTAAGELILVRQHRHAADGEFLEIPGGSTHGPEEDPREAGARELLEETGYTSHDWVSCGFHYPNPALQGNRMHTFLALNCELVSEPQLDPFEDLTVENMKLQDAFDLWQSGGFAHSLISASMALAWKPLRERRLIR